MIMSILLKLTRIFGLSNILLSLNVYLKCLLSLSQIINVNNRMLVFSPSSTYRNIYKF